MKISIIAAALLFIPPLATGCARHASAPASAVECRQACEHTAQLKVAPLKKQLDVGVHEIDEKVDRTEDDAKVTLQLLKEQLASGGPPWNEKSVRTLSPAIRRSVIEHHKWEEAQLKLQRELAIKRSQDSVVEVRKEYADAKGKADIQLKKASADAVDECYDPCLKRPAAEVKCLLRTQAVEDIKLCEHL